MVGGDNLAAGQDNPVKVVCTAENGDKKEYTVIVKRAAAHDGTVEELCTKFREKNIPYGFGGIASLGKGIVPAEKIIKEHYRLGSTCAILSRSFCNCNKIDDIGIIRSTFVSGIRDIREFETECEKQMVWGEFE